jgi:hypothetical protein
MISRTMQRFANPRRFKRLSAAILPWTGGATLVLFAVLVFSPTDWQQGETVRIMYVHVPMAWLAMGGYTGLAMLSIMSLIWRHPLADLTARELSPVGAAFTALCLATGSLWGKPMWGTWWVWDARLTSCWCCSSCGSAMPRWCAPSTTRSAARGRRDPGAGRHRERADREVLGGLVEHAAPAGERHAARFVTVLLWRMEAALAERRLATRRMLAEAGMAAPAVRV